MTTPQAAAKYEAEHVAHWHGRPCAVFNPNDKPIGELPTIYGFNNGWSPGWMHAQLIAEDGTPLGSHLCSSESYMPSDLGCLEGSRPDRHEKQFQPHYPNGYRMEFVSGNEVDNHEKLMAAITIAQSQPESAEDTGGNASAEVMFSEEAPHDTV